jgi:hypothetical protein
MQGRDWLWLRGKIPESKDSVMKEQDRRIREYIQTLKPITDIRVNISIDSLPGALLIGFYQILRSHAGENVERYTAIYNAITAHPQLLYWIGLIDANKNRDRDESIRDGRLVWYN